MSQFFKLHLLFVIIFVQTTVGSEVYITPSQSNQCLSDHEVEHCFTLSTLADYMRTDNLPDLNITELLFLAGNHVIEKELIMSHIKTLALYTKSPVNTSITCREGANMSFINITNLQISGIEFIRCSSSIEYVEQFNLEYSSFHGGNNGSALHLNQANADIVHSSFTHNTVGSYHSHIAFSETLNDSTRNLEYTIRSNGVRAGGAIVAISSNLSISDSWFDDNMAEVGGAILTRMGSNVTITGSTFVNNSATGCNDSGHGGALFIDRGCIVKTENNTFVNNTSGFGGVFTLFQGVFHGNNNIYTGNKASFGGGAISAHKESSITIHSSRYSNTSANANQVTSYITSGGVILMRSECKMTVYNSSFDKSEAGVDGGVMSASFSSSITVYNSSFDSSEAGDDDGVISALYSSSITVYNSSFDNSEAGDDGGVMSAFYSSSITVYNSSFDNSEAGEDGGVFSAVYSSSITVYNCTFNNSEAGKDGGVIFVASSSSITVYNSSFDNSEVGDDGGVMRAFYSSRITVYNSSFDKSEAGRHGGVMHASSNCSIIVFNSSFDNSEAARYGGVMYAYFSSSITVYNSSFDTSEAGDDGGVMCTSSSSNITVYNSSFDNSEAGDDGGAMHALFSSRITVYNSSFDNSEAGGDGGVMSASSSSSITVYNSSFDNSEVGSNGGVMIALSSSSITVYSSSFNKSDAGNAGGVLYAASLSTITVDNCSFDNNKADSGGILYGLCINTTTLYKSSFENNIANVGGVIYATRQGFESLECSGNTTVIIENCVFVNNSANEGGVVYVRTATLTDNGSVYYNNRAHYNGGVVNLNEVVTKVTATSFVNNTAGNSGGVLFTPIHFHQNQISFEMCNFGSNRAIIRGGAFAMLANDILTVTGSSFTHNHANRGGVIYLLTGNKVTLSYCNVSQNSAQRDGGVIFSENQNILKINDSNLNLNIADNNGGVLYLLVETELNISGMECSLMENQAHSGGAIYASESNVHVHSQRLFMANNTATEAGGAIHLSKSNATFVSDKSILLGNQAHRGGSIYASESKLDVYSQSLLLVSNTAAESGGAVHLSKATLTYFSGIGNASERQQIFTINKNTLVGNQADFGGAIYACESKVLIEMHTPTNISANSAKRNGGGLYLTSSELAVKGYSMYIARNKAGNIGGGLHADNSSIKIEGAVQFVNNEAENGGGVGLERYSKFYGTLANNYGNIDYISNIASSYGGAVYVNDETNPDMCVADSVQNTTWKNECFLTSDSDSVSISWWNNSAGKSGSNLFGGLLDRCKVDRKYSHEDEIHRSLGVDRFLSSSNINESQLDTISSHPIRLCFCRERQPDCDYQPEPTIVNRGKRFTVELIAYNQIHEDVSASIYSTLNATAGGLDEGQDVQKINEACTKLQFTVFSPRNHEELTMSIIGPCNVSDISQKHIMIENICTCPIGFQISSNSATSCECGCHEVFQPYVRTQCNATLNIIIRKDNFWITYINKTNSSGYLIYQNCPYDYCQLPERQVHINLNIPNGSEAQCASNRSGILCGNCKPGFSVSLGSSSCMLCPTYWPGLMVTVVTVFILSGIGLVALILALNLTVAAGTLNAIIFYANIMAANTSALFPTSEVTFTSVFISWLNFDLGLDTCFFDGMDTYIKTWLQLAFPAYIIILVVVVIQLSNRFVLFGRLVGKKDPVATLATLILLSYTKLLQTIITAFSSATLNYPDNSTTMVWLPDASVKSFSAKHAVLFFAAILIFLVGMVYTFLVFTWQWFLRCPRKRAVLVKMSSFMETYNVPYRHKHRYWTGLLLLVRVAIYLVSAINPSNDPRLVLLCTNFIVSCLFIYMTVFGIKIYKNRLVNTMETFTYFNILAVSIFTWYSFDSNNTNQAFVTNVSVGITFTQLMLVIVYHTYKNTNRKLSTRIRETMLYIKIKGILLSRLQKRANHKPPPEDSNIYRFLKLLDIIDRPVNDNDYNIPQVKQKPGEPTKSVVELPKPCLASPPPLEVINQEPQNQPSEEDITTALDKNLSTSIDENKIRINHCSGVEISDSEYTRV